MPQNKATSAVRGVARETCMRCGVHRRVCVCSDCTPVIDAPEIWVLQHPDEVGRTKGTLRIAQACLPNLQVLVGENRDDFRMLEEKAARGGHALLFPTTFSAPLEHSRLPVPRKWIVIDGTWRKARRLFLSNPWLMSLPAFHFQTAPLSRYRIRKSNRAGGLSTVESISYLLSLAYPQCDHTPLDSGLDAMVRAQLAQMPPEVRSRYD